MSDLTMEQAKRDFARGLLKSAKIVAAPLGGWSISVKSAIGAEGEGWLIDAKKKNVRVMKTLDAAVSQCQQIGFEVKELSIK